ncbi:hypothetical protein HU200_053206 [Digitaria exilis]|uniref:Uncharacterized protein n=1 Tax=Digitaria exilis TaxID=1010633 RepID=A0A835AML9_9POAL|nr:hypothetical protein HU200_053206 [Digitaria exilis]
MVALVDGGAARAAGRLGPGETASGGGGGEADHVRRLHRHAPADHQCTSTLVKHIKAPVHLVSFPLPPYSLLASRRTYLSGIASLPGSGVPSSIPDALVSDRCVRSPLGVSLSAIPNGSVPWIHRALFRLLAADCRVADAIRSQVWELVRSFDQPQRYKPFVSRCIVRGDQLEIGSLREVNVKTGLPATTSTERLEQLDDDEHILGVKFVGGDFSSCPCTLITFLHMPCSTCALLAWLLLLQYYPLFFFLENCYHFASLQGSRRIASMNYSSIITVHPESIDGRPGTLVIESFVVDVPDGNTKDETCYFVEAVIKCNLTSLAEVSERLAVQSPTSPLEH